MSNSNWRVSVRTDPKEIARLVGVDRADLERSPFQRAQWLETWFGSFAAAPSEIYAASIEDSRTGESVFVLPLMVENRGGIIRLKAWDSGVSDYNAPVLSKSFAPSREDMNALWANIIQALPKADLLELEKLPSVIGNIGNPLMVIDGLKDSKFTRHPLPLPVDGDFEKFAAARFNPSHRRSLAKKRKKLQNKGKLEFALEAGADALPTLEKVLEWRGNRFAERSDPEKSEQISAFYRSLCVHTDIARVGRLTLDGKLLAGCFGTLTDGTFQLLAVAHDGDFKNWSPGLLAIESSIALLCARGVTVYDFTIGDEPYKMGFGVEVEKLYELQTALTLKGMIYLRLRALKRRLQTLVRRGSPPEVAAETPEGPTSST